MKERHAARNVAIRFLFGNGIPMKELSQHYGLSRARVSQIVGRSRLQPVSATNGHRGGPPLTPGQRRLRARIGACALHAQGKTSTIAAGAAFRARFADAADPDAALRAYMTSLSLKASRAKTTTRGA